MARISDPLRAKADRPAADSRVAVLPADIESAAPATAARAPDPTYHRILLAIALATIAAAFLLVVQPDQRVALRGLPQWPLPEACQSKVVLGIPCPGCGLTRSFVYLAAGEWRAARAVHPLGWLVAALVLAQIPYRVWALRHPNSAPLGSRLPWLATWTVVALLLANWAIRTFLAQL